MDKIKMRAFTIVELLIVIVVIAILAAISVVAYNGIQDRAARTETVSALSSYVKALKLYTTDKGVYPAYTNACLGGSKNINNRCYQVNDSTTACSGSGRAWGNSSFDSEISDYMGGNLAVPSQKTYNCGGAPYAGALYYSSNPTVTAYLFAIMKAGVGPCPIIGSTAVVTTNTQDEIIICRYQLPNL